MLGLSPSIVDIKQSCNNARSKNIYEHRYITVAKRTDIYIYIQILAIYNMHMCAYVIQQFIQYVAGFTKDRFPVSTAQRVFSCVALVYYYIATACVIWESRIIVLPCNSEATYSYNRQLHRQLPGMHDEINLLATCKGFISNFFKPTCKLAIFSAIPGQIG